MDYSRINELKKLPYIYPSDNVTTQDLLLKDEDGHTYLEYIAKNDIYIGDDELTDYIGNNYDYLKYLTDNKYYLRRYANGDLLLKEINGERLIVKLFKEKPSLFSYIISTEIIYVIFGTL